MMAKTKADIAAGEDGPKQLQRKDKTVLRLELREISKLERVRKSGNALGVGG